MSDIIKYNEWIIIEEHIKYIDSLSNTINEGKIDVMGDVSKGWKDFDVRSTGAKQVEVLNQENTIEG